jgi:hypothetical protein
LEILSFKLTKSLFLSDNRTVPSKALQNLGETHDTFFRAKALKVLGTSEKELFRSEIVERE